MNCPICNNDISQQGDDSNHEMLDVGKAILSWFNPLGFTKNVLSAGKVLYYDIEKFPNATGYSRCKKCGNYIFECPHCGCYTSGGVALPELGKKHTCPSCKKVFVYAVYLSPDDAAYLR